MAQHYQASPFSGQHVHLPPSSLYVTKPQSSGLLPNYQQNFAHNATPVPMINSKHTDRSVLQTQTPPPPIPFPLNLDPALLKQLANASGMPFPPPPPPPPLPPLPLLSGQSIGPPPPQRFTSQMPPHMTQGMVDGRSQTVSAGPSFTMQSNVYPTNLTNQAPSHFQSTSMQDQTQSHNPRQPALFGPQTSKLHSHTTLDSLSHEDRLFSHHSTRNTSPPAQPTDLDLRQLTKNALSELHGHGISFQDLAQEGISRKTLGSLFEELGLQVPEITPALTEASSIKSHTIPHLPQIHPPTLGPEDAGLERKDRIAKLLKARKAQTGHVGALQSTTSAGSQSPMSQAYEPVKAPACQSPGPAVGIESSGRREQSTFIAPDIISKDQTGQSLNLEVTNESPIPGLDMFVADESTPPSQEIWQVPVKTSPVRKRSADELESGDTLSLPHPDAPEPPSMARDKVEERMAELKARLLRRNSKKKPVQEEVLNVEAEVQDVRDQLEHKGRLLEATRQRVGEISVDLEAAKSQERQLTEEMEVLGLRLARCERGRPVSNGDGSDSKTGEPPNQQRRAILPSPDSEQQSPPVDGQEDGSHDHDHDQPSGRSTDHERSNSQSAEDTSGSDDMTKDIRQHRSPYAVLESQSAGSAHDNIVERLDETTTPKSDDSASNDGEDDHMSIDEVSVAGSTGSASMSGSSSDEYEPDSIMQDDETLARTALQAQQHSHADSETSRSSVKELAEDGRRATDTTMLTDNPPLHPDRETTNSPSDETANSRMEIKPSVVSERRQELRPTSESPVTTGQIGLDSSFPNTSYRFTPYESPLAGLKSYRFHPDFNQKVKDGYRSLTYSNSIDPNRPLCPAELNGQTCDDLHCEEQHFRSLNLSDDKILVQLSSASDITDKQQRDKFLLGLKKVIAGLREQGVKEFSEVASALLQHRRDWAMNQSATAS